MIGTQHEPPDEHKVRTAFLTGLVFGVVLSLVVFGVFSFSRRRSPSCLSTAITPNPGESVHCTPSQELVVDGPYIRCQCL